MSDRTVLFSPFPRVEEYLKSKKSVLILPAMCDGVYWKLPSEHMMRRTRENLLYYRINRLSHLIDSCGAMYGREVSYWLHVHLDSHIGMVIELETTGHIKQPLLRPVVHEKAMPDYSTDVMRASFSYHKHSSRWFASISSIFAKCMPENGQPRSLNAFIVKLLRRGNEATDSMDNEARHGASVTTSCLRRLIQCSMLGNYLHCDYRPPFATRKLIIQEVTSSSCVSLLEAGHRDSLLIYYIVREYMSVIAQYVPAFSEVMERSVLWGKQTGRVRDIMRCTRQQAHHADDWKCVFSKEEVTEQMRKHYKRMPKKKIRKRKPDPGTVFKTILHREISKRKSKWAINHATARRWIRKFITGAGVTAIREIFMDNTSGDIQRNTIQDLAHAIYIRNKSVHKFVQIKPLADVSDEKLFSMYDFIYTATSFESISHIQLPPQMASAQMDAICRRFSCENTCIQTINRVACVKICPGCYGIRNFYITDDEPAGSKLIKAQGYTNVVCSAFEDYTPTVVCCEKSHCRHYELIDFFIVRRDAAGVVQSEALQIGEICITVSPCCGILCSTNHIYSTANGFACPSCLTQCASNALEQEKIKATEEPPAICMHCCKEMKKKHMSCVLIDEKGEEAIRSFCKRHWRHWYMQKPTLTIEYVKKQHKKYTMGYRRRR